VLARCRGEVPSVVYPNPTKVYHITRVENLPSIVGAGLLCTTRKSTLKVGHKDIAYAHIQDRRALTTVPLPPDGGLHDYVPFYFGPRSPMLYVRSKEVEDGTSGQVPIIHLVATAQRIVKDGLRTVFTDGHGTMALSKFYDDLADLDKLAWGIIQGKYWHDTDEYPDRSRRRQAELLVHEHLPWKYVEEIGVINAQIKTQVENALSGSTHKPTVRIQPTWYYRSD
jgi:hypothetical protein